jgi:hypothetical protein
VAQVLTPLSYYNIDEIPFPALKLVSVVQEEQVLAADL